MKAQESLISVELVASLSHYPKEAWDVAFYHLDMYTEDVIEELTAITWAEGREYPNHSRVSAKTGVVNWGGSGSFSEIVLQISTGTMGGVGAAAIGAAVKTAYGKLKRRAQGEPWDRAPSQDQALQLVKSRLHQHYAVAVEDLRVTRSEVNADAQTCTLEFVHADGRRFGGVVGAVPGIPSCTRVWMDSSEELLRPMPAPRGEAASAAPTEESSVQAAENGQS